MNKVFGTVIDVTDNTLLVELTDGFVANVRRGNCDATEGDKVSLDEDAGSYSNPYVYNSEYININRVSGVVTEVELTSVCIELNNGTNIMMRTEDNSLSEGDEVFLEYDGFNYSYAGCAY